jgi:colanic acid biosynthesis glycosyl transferase WcaI
MTPLHVAFFNRSFYPDTSATGQLLTELCETLVTEHRCRVSVVAGVPLIGPLSRVRGAGIRAFSRDTYRGIEILRARGTRLPKRRFVGRATNYVTYFLSACVAGLCLRSPDVVVGLTDPPIIGLAAYLAARWFRVPLVMAYKDVFPEVAVLLEDFQSPLVNRVLQKVNCFLVRKADRTLALGETMRRRLIDGKNADPARTQVIPDWIDCADVVPGPRDNEFARAHQLTDRFVVMHSGNLGLSQGLETLVDAAAQLVHLEDLEIVFVGDGVLRSALQARARTLGLANVRFLPYQPKERLTESFGTADVFVVSLKAGLAGYIVPSKLYGILGAGRPYVAAVEAESEVSTITQTYQCGLLAEPGNARDLAAKITTLYHDRPLAERMGRNARAAALHFDRRPHVRAYHDVFRDVVTSSSARAPRLKRVMDAAVAALGLVCAAPLVAVITCAIKLDDGGPVFYSQRRVGRGGRHFQSWKFRSMVADADMRFGPRQAQSRDVRVTRVGRVLRATAMDELPQLWNILKGDMSLVGPRPLMPEEIEVTGSGDVVPIDAVPGFQARHRVRPGLTGIAQIYADRDIPRRQKFRYDRLYLDVQGVMLDLRLIALSFWITVRGRWEHRGRKF